MNTPLHLAVHGAAGRMGRRVVALAVDDPAFQLAAAIDHPSSPWMGRDAGELAGTPHQNVPLCADWPETADVVIDFSLPTAIAGCVQACVERQLPLVVATTGLDESQKQALQDAAKTIAIVWAPSMSLAVNLTMKLAQQVASKLHDVSGGLDIEILERHHRFKADAPSGTALKFGELIADQLPGDIQHVHGRQGHTGERTRNEIGYHAIRVGDNPGEHTIVFGMLGERIELNVAASNRDCYAAGALSAAKFVVKQPPGIYNMFDVLGLS